MVPASYGRYGQRAARIRPASIIMPDPTSRIRFSSVFPDKAWITLCKTDPGPIWMAWSGFGQTRLVRKQTGVPESSGPVSVRRQPARYQFPTSRLGSVLPQTSRTTLWKTSPVPIWFWLIVCARFGPNGSGPEASRCARLNHPVRFWPMRSSRCDRKIITEIFIPKMQIVIFKKY